MRGTPRSLAKRDPGRHTGAITASRPSSAIDRPGFRRGFRAGVPFAAAGSLLSVTFGALAVDAGFPTIAVVLMSAVVFAGSAQFAALAVVVSGGTLGAALGTAALAHSRFLPMGIAIGPSLPGGPVRRALEGQAVVDASWAMAARPDGTFDRSFLLGSTAVQYVTWVLGTVVGAYAGDAIGDTDRFGLDAVYPTFFLVLLIAELRSGRGRGVAAAGALVALALVPVAPPGVPVMAAGLASLVGLWVRPTPGGDAGSHPDGTTSDAAGPQRDGAASPGDGGNSDGTTSGSDGDPRRDGGSRPADGPR